MSKPFAIRARRAALVLPVSRRRQRNALPDEALPVGGTLRKNRKKQLMVTAVHPMSFTITPGDRVGLVGHNGAGKSSMLRMLGGIYPPTSGSCEVRGRISTLFSSNLGMQKSATGLRNIYLAGYMQGLPKSEIDRIVDDVAEFSELGEFLKLPMTMYSAGMATRIGFAMATAVHPDVLLIDEVFGTGDRRFQRKARARLSKMFDRVNTLVMASHSTDLVRQFCDKALWLEHGRLRGFGPVDEVLAAYGASQGGGHGTPGDLDTDDDSDFDTDLAL